MDVAAFPLTDGHHVVATACSDAYIRIWLFDEETSTLSLKATSGFHAHCVLKVRALLVPALGSIDATYYLFSGGTDGGCADTVVDLGPPLHVESVHQSGVNGMDVRVVKTTQTSHTLLLATGGDDNAVSTAFISLDTATTQLPTARTIATGKISSAHSSPVTGISIATPITILSTSVDQRLNRWALSLNEGTREVGMELEGSEMVDVADASDMDVRVGRDGTLQVVVVGVGMEVLELRQG
ncbi:hypothetical protein BDK51DRAFT_34223 [Blyttiomyces helicus]|uniref:WD40-repeat-containing domain protein n=1 Tax=Blyttiomyces helicus TaxID=388810 RepID=A0A4P9VZP2_9FUNG|nr:hypothetical protein BDK51DRAFT_34223 [Blyttiomyces helicus]|eukprot:RKO85301.1 hypothetical protein BDK51DRAFT_34223 [Blyttiomyces helicus]